MTHETLKEIKKEWHGSLKSYVIGFFSSLVLTAVSFSLVIGKVFPQQILIYAVIGLAITQAIIQLLFFLHVGHGEATPRWATLTLCFTILILLVIMIGSLWIMHDLNARMMPGMP